MTSASGFSSELSPTEILAQMESLQRITLLVAARAIDREILDFIANQIIQVSRAGGVAIRVTSPGTPASMIVERGDSENGRRASFTAPVRSEYVDFGLIKIAGVSGVPLPSESVRFVQDIATVLAVGIQRAGFEPVSGEAEFLLQLATQIKSLGDAAEAHEALVRAAEHAGFNAVHVLETSATTRLVSSLNERDLVGANPVTIAESEAIQHALESRSIQSVVAVGADSGRYRPVSREAGAAIIVPIVFGAEALGVVIGEMSSDSPATRQQHEYLSFLSDQFALLLGRERDQLESTPGISHPDLVTEIMSFASDPDQERVLARITDRIQEQRGWSCSIGRIEGQRVMFPAVSCGLTGGPPAWLDEGMPLGVGVTGRVAASGEPVAIWDVGESEQYLAVSDDVVSEICVPIYSGTQLIGILNAESHAPERMEQRDLEHLETLASVMGNQFAERFLADDSSNNPGEVRMLQEISEVLSGFDRVDKAVNSILRILLDNSPLIHAAVLLRRRSDYVILTQAGDEAHFLAPALSVSADVVEDVFARPDEMDAHAKFGQAVMDGSMEPESYTIHPLRKNDDLLGVLLISSSAPRVSEINALTDIASGHLSFLLASAHAQDELKQLAALDPITEVPNHRFFQQRLAAACSQARRESRSLSLLVIDLDDFKAVNDKFGHLIGDAILRSTAGILTDLLRGDDLLARYAGDEFVALLVDADEEIADRVARRLVSSISRHPFEMPDNSRLALTLSIGAATVPGDGITSHDLLRAADAAMYMTKDIGKNGIAHHRDAENVKRGDLIRRLHPNH